MSNKPSISFRPTPEVAEQLKARAAADRRPLSHLVANIVADAMAAAPDGNKSEQRSAA